MGSSRAGATGSQSWATCQACREPYLCTLQTQCRLLTTEQSLHSVVCLFVHFVLFHLHLIKINNGKGENPKCFVCPYKYKVLWKWERLFRLQKSGDSFSSAHLPAASTMFRAWTRRWSHGKVLAVVGIRNLSRKGNLWAEIGVKGNIKND